MKQLIEIEVHGKIVMIRDADGTTIGAGSPRTATNGLKEHLDAMIARGDDIAP